MASSGVCRVSGERHMRLLGCWEFLGDPNISLVGWLLVSLVVAMSLPSGPFSFTKPLTSSGALAQMLLQHVHEQMLGFRASLGNVSDAASTNTWVTGFGAVMVRLLPPLDVSGY